MAKIYKMYELTKGDACIAKRNFQMEYDTLENEFFHRAVISRGALDGLFDGQLTPGASLEMFLREQYAEVPFPVVEQRDLQVEETLKLTERYWNWEKRHAVKAVPMVHNLCGKMLTNVVPDRVIAGNDRIEVIKYKFGNPNLTKKEVSEDIGLYALLCYGKALVKTGNTANVVASYYYMKRKDDSNGRVPHFDITYNDTPCSSLTGGAMPPSGNIVSICEHDYVGGTTMTALDTKYAAVIQDFLDGIPKDECSDKDCEACDLRALCRFTEPPVSIVKEPVVRHAQDIVMTEAQQNAVAFKKGICRINAGAGAGKTMVIALRTAMLLSMGVKPEEIVLMTFTVAGAEEMRNRIALYVEDFGLEIDVKKMKICTFNSFGDEIIRKEYAKLGFTAEPSVIDDVERASIITELLNNTYIDGLNYRYFTMNSRYVKGALVMAEKVFGIMKQYRLGVKDVKEIVEHLGEDSRFVSRGAVEVLAKLYWKYDDVMRKNNLIDFADQEALLFELLHNEPFYMEKFGFKHIIVDEFQDSNLGQMNLIKILRQCPSFESLMVIGDDSQAIFSFRDTSPEYILDFDQFMGEPVEDIFLLENHRSTPEIIDFANKINANNRNRVKKDLLATRPHGKPVIVKGFLTREEECSYVVDGIDAKIKSGIPAEDIAVICATKYELLDMANRLGAKGIPTVLLNPEQLLENSRVNAAISFVIYLDNRTDTKDLLVYANARVGGKIMEMSREEIQAVYDTINAEIEVYDAMEKDEDRQKLILDKLRELDQNNDEVYAYFLESLGRKRVGALAKYCIDFTRFGENVAFRRVHDYPGVVLTTAHSSKGLEWKYVFDMISKYHTENMGGRNAYAISEERRRLLFVSATRARDELVVTGQYVAFGKKGDYTYNKFLVESYRAVGQQFDIATIEAERELRKMKEREAKKAEKIAKEKENLEKAAKTA